MLKRKTSAFLSLSICIFFAAVLLILVFTFPRFFHWLYVSYHGLDFTDEITTRIVNTVTAAFYICVPFAGAALYSLIRLMMRAIKDEIFVKSTVNYLRVISLCCYAVFLITGGFGLRYVPLFIIALAMVVVGTLVRVVKNVMQSAIELKEENDLTV